MINPALRLFHPGQHEALGTYSLVGWLLIRLKERETAGKMEIGKQGQLGLERDGQVDIREYWLLPSRTYTDRETRVGLQGLQRLQDTETDRETGRVARVAKVARYRDR